jgi:hypothetical protein
VLWRVAQSQYDPLGLLSVYMVKWKLLMRKVTLKGKEGGWETPLDKEEEEEFRQLLRDLKELREIRFPRCVQPLEGQFKNPMLLVFGDGSREAGQKSQGSAKNSPFRNKILHRFISSAGHAENRVWQVPRVRGSEGD